MRNFLFALLVAIPATAFGQTAADIARQQYPLQVPAAGISAPTAEPVFGGFDHDVSRTVWLRSAPLAHGVAPAARATGSFLSADIARMRDEGRVAAPHEVAPYLTAVAR